MISVQPRKQTKAQSYTRRVCDNLLLECHERKQSKGTDNATSFVSRLTTQLIASTVLVYLKPPPHLLPHVRRARIRAESAFKLLSAGSGSTRRMVIVPSWVEGEDEPILSTGRADGDCRLHKRRLVLLRTRCGCRSFKRRLFPLEEGGELLRALRRYQEFWWTRGSAATSAYKPCRMTRARRRSPGASCSQYCRVSIASWTECRQPRGRAVYPTLAAARIDSAALTLTRHMYHVPWWRCRRELFSIKQMLSSNARSTCCASEL